MPADNKGSTTIVAAPLSAQSDEVIEVVPHSTRSDALIEAVFERKDEHNYQPQQVFAEGGMGRILEARDQRLQRRVVLKVLQTHAPDLRDRFLREALITAKLQHPAIVPIYDFGQWSRQAPIPSMGLNGGEPFYVMKLVEGQSLGELIEQADDTGARLALLRHVTAAAEAMAYAHDRRVIHRDLKPDNILVGPFGETVVIDWGLAKELSDEPAAPSPIPGLATSALPEGAQLAMDATLLADPNDSVSKSGRRLTVAGTVMGTPDYMAPEQAAGGEADFRADVWALGAILYELLAGDTPYGGDTVTDKLKAILTGPPPPLHQRVPGLPPDLVAIVSKAMAHLPDDRYPSARELMDDLRRFETGQIVSAHQYTTRERVQRFIARHKVAFGVATAALAALLAIGVFAVSRIIAARDRADDERKQAQQARAKATRHADDLLLLQARAAIKTDPNAALQWLGQLSPEADAWDEVRLLASDARAQGLSIVLRDHSNTVGGLTFSPDGRWLASASDDHSGRLYATDSWQSRTLTGAGDEMWSGFFSPDSRRLLFRTKDQNVLVWDVAQERGPLTLSGHQTRINRAVFSPDSKQIASWGYQRGLWLWDVEAQKGTLRFKTTRDDMMVAVSRDHKKLGWISNEGLLAVWDWQGEPGTLLGYHDRQIRLIAFSADGRYIVSGSVDGEIRVWSRDGGMGRRRQLYEKLRFIQPIPGSSDFITTSYGGKVDRFNPDTAEVTHLAQDPSVAFSMSISDDGDKVVWCTAEAVRFMELSTGRLTTLRGFDKRITTVAIAPDGGWVAAASEDFTTRLWRTDALDGRRVAHWPGIRSWAFSADMRLAAGLSREGQLQGGTLDAPRRYDTGSYGAERVALSPDGATIATGFDNGSIHTIERQGGTTRTLRGHAGTIRRLLFSVDGVLLSGGQDGRVLLWRRPFDKPQQLAKFPGGVAALARSDDGRHIAASSTGGQLLLWTRGERFELPAKPTHAITALAFTPDGNTLLAGAEDHSIRAFDAATREQRYEVSHQLQISHIVVSPSGKRFASITQSIAGVQVWDTGSGKRLMKESISHRSSILAAAFSPDDSRLATAGSDHDIYLWELGLAQSRVLSGHTAPVTHVRFAEDGRSLLSADGNGAVRRWYEDLPRGEEAMRSWLAEAIAGSTPRARE